MKLKFLVGLILMMAQISKNDPTGVWQAETISKFNLKLTGSDLKVTIVPDSNPKFLEYEVNLTLQKDIDINTYKGTGHFVAKMAETGKECKLETEWQLTVVQPSRIFGSATSVLADSKTCEVKEKSDVRLDLTKVQ